MKKIIPIIILLFSLAFIFSVSSTSTLNYLGEQFTHSDEINTNSTWITTISALNYRDYTVARTNYTLYCNVANKTSEPTYRWYKNDVEIAGETSNSLSSNNFIKGDLIICETYGLYNSTDRYILDTTIGDFSNGTIIYSNLTTQSGNVTLNWNSNNLKDTLLLLHFDENYTQDFNLTDDVSIYNNNGNCKNMTTCPVFNSSGYIGGAFEFDGVDDYFNLSDTNKLEIQTTNFSISVWAFLGKDTTVSSNNMIISKDWCGDNNMYILTSNGTGALTFRMVNSVGTNFLSGTTSSLSGWHYIAVSRQAGNIYLYNDGVLVNGTTVLSGTFLTNGYPVEIGSRSRKDAPSCLNFFNGTIDEVRIWNRRLTSDEILRNYQAGLKKLQPSLNNYEFNATFTSSIFDLGKTPNMSKISWGHDTPHSSYYYQSGLIFGWDGAVNYSYTNTSIKLQEKGKAGNDIRGNLIGNNQSIFPDNNGSYFNGTVSINTGSDFIGTNPLTVSAWIYAKDWGGGGIGRIVDNGKTYLRMDSTGRLRFYSDNSNPTYSGVNSIALNTWYHVVATRNKNAITNFYINGILSGDTNQNGVSVLAGTNNVIIGNSNSGASYFNGTIDEVHIWNRALSSDEIQNMYNISKNKYPISLQTRMGNNATDTTNWGNWGNTTSTSDAYYINNSGEDINFTYNGSARYIQYRAEFNTLDSNVTPVLSDVVMKEIDYKVRIFNSEPFSNFTAWFNNYIENVINTTNTYPIFNITNVSDLDGIGDLRWNLEIYNGSGSLNQSFYNLSLDNFTLSTSLIEGNYSWRARINDTVQYDDVYENYLTSWTGTRSFNLYTTIPTLNIDLILPKFDNSTKLLNTNYLDLNVSGTGYGLHYINISFYTDSSRNNELTQWNQYKYCNFGTSCNHSNYTIKPFDYKVDPKWIYVKSKITSGGP